VPPTNDETFAGAAEESRTGRSPTPQKQPRGINLIWPMPRSAIVGILPKPGAASRVDGELASRHAGEMGLPHQPQIDRPGRLAPLVDRPDDQ